MSQDGGQEGDAGRHGRWDGKHEGAKPGGDRGWNRAVSPGGLRTKIPEPPVCASRGASGVRASGGGRVARLQNPKKKIQTELRKLTSVFNQLSHHNDVERALVLFYEVRDKGLDAEGHVFSQLLNLLCRDGATAHVDHVDNVVAVMKQRGVPLVESSGKAMVAMQLSLGDIDGAFSTVQELAASGQPLRRRILRPVLQAVCGLGEDQKVTEVLKLFGSSSVDLEEDEFVELLALCLGDKDVKSLAGEPMERPTRMAEVMDLLTDLLHGVPERIARSVEAWFARRGRIPQVAHISASGRCSVCRTKLGNVDVRPDQVASMLRMIDKMVERDLDGKSRSFELEGSENIFRDGTPQGLRGAGHFNQFKKFIEANRGKFDTVIDGANVGFFLPLNGVGHKYERNTINLSKIDKMTRQLQDEGRRPLIFLHASHVMPRAIERSGYAPMVNEWIRTGVLYVTPFGMNDDWFWLYAGLALTQEDRNAVVLSNDKMTDHHSALLLLEKTGTGVEDPRRGGNSMARNASTFHEFVLWRNRHWVTFELPRPREDGRHRENSNDNWKMPFALTFPPAYTTAVQAEGVVASSPVARLMGRWHVPYTLEAEARSDPFDTSSTFRDLPDTHRKYQWKWLCIPPSLPPGAPAPPGATLDPAARPLHTRRPPPGGSPPGRALHSGRVVTGGADATVRRASPLPPRESGGGRSSSAAQHVRGPAWRVTGALSGLGGLGVPGEAARMGPPRVSWGVAAPGTLGTLGALGTPGGRSLGSAAKVDGRGAWGGELTCGAGRRLLAGVGGVVRRLGRR